MNRTAIGPGREAGAHLYAMDLESGKLRRMETGSRNDGGIIGSAITRDGKDVLAANPQGNVERVQAIPAPWGPDESFAVLPDGRAVVAEGTGGRLRLMAVAPG